MGEPPIQEVLPPLHPHDVVGIVPAAGRSTRMGSPKQLLPVNGVPMARAVAETLLSGACSLVVLATRRDLILRLGALPPEVHGIVNDDANAEMIDTVRLAIRYAKQQLGKSRSEPVAYAVCPGDAAQIRSEDVRRCLTAQADNPNHIVVASYAGRRGHPLVIPAPLADIVLSPACELGLNQLLKSHAESVLAVESDSASVLSNVNWPGDLH